MGNIFILPLLFFYTDIIEIHQVDQNGDPVMMDQFVQITGKVTVTSQFGNKGPFFIQDNTAGIAVYDYHSKYIPELQLGDSVVVDGKVIAYKGLTEISYLNNVEIINYGNEIEPDTIEIDEMGVIDNGYEKNEGRYVIIRNVYFTDTGTFEKNKSYTVKDLSGKEGIVYIKSDELVGMEIPQETVFVKGVVNQYDGTSPYFEGYELFPRFPSDIDTMPSGGVITDDEYRLNPPFEVSYRKGNLYFSNISHNSQIEIYDILGNLILEVQLHGNFITFSKKGIYFVKSNKDVVKVIVW